MSKTLREFDPNFVISFTYTKDNLVQLLAEFSIRGFQVLTRPGSDVNTVYAFTRIDPKEERLLDLYDIVHDLSFIQHVNPLYDQETKKRLGSFFDKSKKNLLKFPTDGELVELTYLTGNPRLSLYLAFFINYMKALFFIAIIGLLTRLTNDNNKWEFNLSFTFCVLIWSIYFTANWIYNKKPYYSSKFYQVQELSIDDIQNKNNIKDNGSHLFVITKKIIFIPVMLFFVAVLLGFQLLFFGLEIFVTQLYNGPFITILSLAPTLLLAGVTSILTVIYNSIFVNQFVKFERTSSPSSSKTEKNIILFSLINFSPLLFTLFLYYPLGHHFTQMWNEGIKFHLENMYTMPVIENDFKVNIRRHQDQIFYFTVTNQLVQLAMDTVLPIILNKAINHMKGTEKPNSEHSVILSNFKKEYPGELSYWEQVESYNNNEWGTFDVDINMRKLVIQFGFVVIFSTLWPLAPLIYLLFNIVTFRTVLWRSLIKCEASSIPNNTVTVNEDNTSKHSHIESWDVVLLVLTWFGSFLSPSLALIYNKSNLKNVGRTTLISERDHWYKYPIQQNWVPIFLSIMCIEHLSLFFFLMLSKICLILKERDVEGKVPSRIPELPKKTDLLPVALETKNFMEENKNELKSRNINMSDITKEPSLTKKKDVIDYSKETEQVTGSIKKMPGRRFSTGSNVSPKNGRTDEKRDTLSEKKRHNSFTGGKIFPNLINNHHPSFSNAIVPNWTSKKKHSGAMNDLATNTPTNIYVEGDYHEMHDNHILPTLRSGDDDKARHSSSMRSNTLLTNSNPLVVAAAVAASSGEQHNSRTSTKTLEKNRRSRYKKKVPLKDIKNIDKFVTSNMDDKNEPNNLRQKNSSKGGGNVKNDLYVPSKASDHHFSVEKPRRQSFLNKLRKKL